MGVILVGLLLSAAGAGVPADGHTVVPLPKAKPEEAKQLAVLDDYASGIVTALNTDGLQPFTYAAVEAAQALDEVEASLKRLEKKGLQ